MKQIKEVRFYLEVDLCERVAKLAEKDNRSVENMVETVLKRWVEKEENMREFRANYPLTPDDSYPSRPPSDGKPFNPFVYPYTDIRTDGPIIYHTPPGTVPDGRILTDPPITVCEGTTVGPNGAMFASTDNPNGTCVTNGEEVDIKADIIPCISPEFLKRWENNGDNKFPEEELVVRTDTDPAKVVLDTEDDDFGF
jgi:hypothetical protein